MTVGPLNPPLAPPLLRPTTRFLLAHPAHLIALGFGSGLSPVAPGTVATLWAWAAWLVLDAWLPPGGALWVLAASLPIAWWAGTVAARNLRVLDPAAIVIDEIVSFWLILAFILPASFGGQLAAFLLFRLLDAVKPGPIGWADNLFHGFGWRGGLGILFDDLVAAFCTLLLIALWVRLA